MVISSCKQWSVHLTLEPLILQPEIDTLVMCLTMASRKFRSKASKVGFGVQPVKIS